MANNAACCNPSDRECYGDSGPDFGLSSLRWVVAK
jgi:hypothetical protein